MRTLLDEASDLARLGHEDDLAVRQKTGIKSGAIYLVDKSPYGDGPGRREREFTELKLELQRLGLEVGAVARYPLSGEGLEYTVAIVFELSKFKGSVDEALGVLNKCWADCIGRWAERAHEPDGNDRNPK